MTSTRIPSEEEIRQAIQQGDEAVIELWRETVPALAERIQKLEDQLAENESNSQKLLVSDTNRKRLLTILGTIAAVILLIWFLVAPFIDRMRPINNNPIIFELTLCDVSDTYLCVVSFGTDSADNMIVNFQLPYEGYPLFYIHGANKSMDNLYSCKVAEDTPTMVHCTGARTPLGEAINIDVFSADSDALMAKGTIIVSAMIVITPVIPTPTPASETGTPERETNTPAPTTIPSLFPTAKATNTPTPTATYTPDPAYPNP